MKPLNGRLTGLHCVIFIVFKVQHIADNEDEAMQAGQPAKRVSQDAKSDKTSKLFLLTLLSLSLSRAVLGRAAKRSSRLTGLLYYNLGL
jgi:hypothetical protein